jgi:SAM-dependent methyltransferase
VPRNPFRAQKLTCIDVNADASNQKMLVITPGSRLPFPNETFSSVSAYDVLEHLPRVSQTGNAFVFYMNELCRVLKPGGMTVFVFPSFPHRHAFSDPTLVNFITKDTVNSFLATPNGLF